MKMQKVEVEIPEFNGYEFYGISKIKDLPSKKNEYVALFHDGLIELEFVHQPNIELVIYKKEPPRRIIFEETVVDYVKPGELYIDDFGMPNIWDGKGPSFMKASKLKKTHDDF